jgi:hypothetical protein
MVQEFVCACALVLMHAKGMGLYMCVHVCACVCVCVCVCACVCVRARARVLEQSTDADNKCKPTRVFTSTKCIKCIARTQTTNIRGTTLGMTDLLLETGNVCLAPTSTNHINT